MTCMHFSYSQVELLEQQPRQQAALGPHAGRTGGLQLMRRLASPTQRLHKVAGRPPVHLIDPQRHHHDPGTLELETGQVVRL